MIWINISLETIILALWYKKKKPIKNFKNTFKTIDLANLFTGTIEMVDSHI